MVDENRAATGGMRAIDITPAIANQEAALQVDAMAGSGLQQHSRFRFPASARLAPPAAGVKTNFDPIKRGHSIAQRTMHRLNGFPALGPATDVRLVCDYDEKKSCVLQSLAPFGSVRVKNKLVRASGREGESVANYRLVEHAVAIQKYGRPIYFVLSHFVCAVFSAG
jgi:hypothetical protein